MLKAFRPFGSAYRLRSWGAAVQIVWLGFGGDIKTWPSPSGPASHPYAIEVIDDIVWYNESNQRPDALVRFDPKTEKFQSWGIPSGVGIIRHMRVTPDGNLVIHQSSTNTIGLVTIAKDESR